MNDRKGEHNRIQHLHAVSSLSTMAASSAAVPLEVSKKVFKNLLAQSENKVCSIALHVLRMRSPLLSLHDHWPGRCRQARTTLSRRTLDEGVNDPLMLLLSCFSEMLRMQFSEPDVGECDIWCVHLHGLLGAAPQNGHSYLVCEVRVSFSLQSGLFNVSGCMKAHHVPPPSRSTILDTWQADQLQRMKVGGNAKAREFFKKHGMSLGPDGLKGEAMYTSRAAMLYKQQLDKDVA